MLAGSSGSHCRVYQSTILLITVRQFPLQLIGEHHRWALANTRAKSFDPAAAPPFRFLNHQMIKVQVYNLHKQLNLIQTT